MLEDDLLDEEGELEVVLEEVDDYWRAIPEFPLYDITRDGVIRNGETGKMKRVTEGLKGTVVLFNHKKPFNRSVRRLVLMTFPDMRGRI